ncbi:MAG: M12 family metallo-peptidase [Ignavibacterium sp.]|nr:M12 family metallo-peptidase [Ignavibacterium sp.]
MNNFFRILLFSLLIAFQNGFAQTNSASLWNDVNETQIVTIGERYIVPQLYRTVKLDVNGMKNFLSEAPLEFSEETRSKQSVLYLPMPDGLQQRFSIVEAPIMAPELAAKYPEIKTYLGKGIDDPYAYVRFDFTVHGFHAMILSPEGNVFIDPYSLGDIQNYISYYTKDFTNAQKSFECEVISDESRINELNYLKDNSIFTPVGPQLRTYRLAVATTGEYTAFFGGTVLQGLAAVITSVNRVNGVYEKEVAVRMVIVANNDTLIFTNAATDPYTNNDGGAMLAQNQTTVDARIGSPNYDFGHVFSTGGGGVAFLGVICVAGLKARGVTGSGFPVGDPFDIDYVAHEMGHQFAGNHSFNGTAGACSGGNRNASTAYEPGSGSTIMAYAGICSPQNLQNNSDPYFHSINFDEIVSYTNFGSGNGCAVITATGNSAPVVTVPTGGFYIPKSTPFSLTGSATDADGDALVYCWEEFDLGPAGAPGAPSGNAPIFRSWNPTTSPTRYFPRLVNLLNNTTVIGEILPTYTRTLTFRLTVRDNKVGGGGVNYAAMQFNVDGNSGPFVVTSPNTNITLPGGSTQTILWNAANTNAAPVNCTNVNILLSTDGGQTFSTILAANTQNDGSESVTIPNTPSNTARIKVEAVGNIFFDISNVNFTIEEAIPVELLSFSAQRTDAGVELNWKTATETNNSGFTIERSRDEENFTQIGFVSGRGTTTEITSYNYLDTEIETGKYYYRLKQTDYDGTFKYLNVVLVDAGLPKQFQLSQNHPNPFNPSTTIKFQLPVDANVRIDLYNSIGQKVSELLNNNLSGGVHEVTFEGTNLSSGIYYYTMNAISKDGNSFTSTKKMILMK